MSRLSSVRPLTVAEVGEERFEPSKDLSMYDWLNFLRLRLIDVDADSFLLWRVEIVFVGSWSPLTH